MIRAVTKPRIVTRQMAEEDMRCAFLQAVNDRGSAERRETWLARALGGFFVGMLAGYFLYLVTTIVGMIWGAWIAETLLGWL